ncbi:GABA permease [Peribacillus simplex]|uniref:GABA permease n=1 Tax=Peribacillus simplex TaxID=1478 RepID=A0A9X8RA84_9BACI|nr:GABA permease [Peribacillus simplex]
MAQNVQLQKQLKTRHVTMITIGGVIGAGIFVGSGAVIHSTGPAAVISYLLAGILAMFVARMLGEMATANPHASSFSEHVRLALGNWGGFTVGWLYWYFWVIAVAAEAVGAAGILHYWFPSIPVWAMSLGLLILMTLTNIFSVKSFGEVEFWFASIKVTAIILFLTVGMAYILGLWPDKVLSFENLTTHGGFAPHGIASIFQGIVPVMFAVIGTEIVTITAAESVNPKEAIAKAIKSVIWRIMLFYVGSIFIIICVLPWNHAGIIGSPYVSVIKFLGIPGADQIMNFVVLTALLSCLNSGLYISSRMLFGLANKGDAPRMFVSLNRNGAPVKASLWNSFWLSGDHCSLLFARVSIQVSYKLKWYCSVVRLLVGCYCTASYACSFGKRTVRVASTNVGVSLFDIFHHSKHFSYPRFDGYKLRNGFSIDNEFSFTCNCTNYVWNKAFEVFRGKTDH